MTDARWEAAEAVLDLTDHHADNIRVLQSAYDAGHAAGRKGREADDLIAIHEHGYQEGHAALVRYGRHLDECRVGHSYSALERATRDLCTCGFDEVLKSAPLPQRQREKA